ncbi:MAG: hypothetical protein AAF558_16020, partial [Verrucomicrobiota bacterium]
MIAFESAADDRAKNTQLLEKHYYFNLNKDDQEKVLKYIGNHEERRARLSIPEAVDLYVPKTSIVGQRPRLWFSEIPLELLKKRYAAPEYRPYVEDLKETAHRYATKPPEAPESFDVEDPLRDYGKRLPWICLSYLLETDPKQKDVLLKGAVDMIELYASWPLLPRDLPLSNFMMSMAIAYDWLYDDLPTETRERCRKHLIDMARWIRLPENKGAWQWRSGRQWMANHKWYNYAALGTVSAALWGDEAAPLESGEVKFWMDESMELFWVVSSKVFGDDGAPPEGYLYGDYGNLPVFDFGMVVEGLLDSKFPILGHDYYRFHAISRLHSMLPNQSGFYTYSDSYPRMFGGGVLFRYLAYRYQDPKAQSLAALMERSKNHATSGRSLKDWRSLFWCDLQVGELTEEDWDTLPNFHDSRDLGLYVARTSWLDPNAIWMGLKCGPPAGKHIASIWYDPPGWGHLHPDAGSIVFYAGTQRILPGAEYPYDKWTTDHSLPVFDGTVGRQKGKLVGQVGEKGRWGQSRNDIQRHARVTQVLHHDRYHAYVCDLGGVYRLFDARAEKMDRIVFPDYQRLVVFLQEGKLVVVDRFKLRYPRTCHFRLSTAAGSMSLVDGHFQMHFGDAGISWQIRNLSQEKWIPSVVENRVKSWSFHPEGDLRKVATLTAKERSEGIFAVVLEPSGSNEAIAVDADHEKVVIQHGQQEIRLNW